MATQQPLRIALGMGLVICALQVPLLLLLLDTLPTLFAPLRPPLAWDALMYHLPHARE